MGAGGAVWSGLGGARRAWDNDDLDAVVDAERRDRSAIGARKSVWEVVWPSRSTPDPGVLWYALERLGEPVDGERFFTACDRNGERPRLETVEIPPGRFLMGSRRGRGTIHGVGVVRETMRRASGKLGCGDREVPEGGRGRSFFDHLSARSGTVFGHFVHAVIQWLT